MTTPNLRLTEIVLMGGSHDGARWSVKRDYAGTGLEMVDSRNIRFMYVPLLNQEGAHKLDETGAKIYVATGWYSPSANIGTDGRR